MELKVNSKLLPLKAHFFLIFSALAPLLPFLPVYAKQLGFDAFGVGVIFAGNSIRKKTNYLLVTILVLPFTGMIAKPVAGWIADHFSRQKLVFIISIAFTGIGYFFLQTVSNIEADNESQLLCSYPQSILKVVCTYSLLISYPSM